MALFGPAWQSSVSEQVPPEALPSAVALNGISYNIARSFGPAIGGVIVAALGAVAAFACNAILYLPLLVVLLLWRRTTEPSRLPREKLNRAMVSGFRYITNSPPIKIVLLRTLVIGLIGGAVMALMPLVARDLLHGGAQTYGIMLGAFGMGAVDRRAQHRRDPQAHERRSGDPRLHDLDGVCDRRGGAQQRAGADRRRAGAGRRGLDARGRAVQYRRAAFGAALGRWPFARRVPGLDLRRHRDRRLGLGPSHRLCRRRGRAAGGRRR